MRKVILFYNTMWGGPLDVPAAIPEPYTLTTDRNAVDDAVAIVFHVPTLPAGTFPNGPIKRKGQLWVAWCMECEAHYPQMQDRGFMDRFDLKMTHRLDSDIAVPYLEYDCPELLRMSPSDKDDGKLVNAFVSSHLNKSRRIEYILQLMMHIDVHSYGKLFRNRSLDGDNGRWSRLETMKRYKFTLAFENAIAMDYVTEKFYDPLIAGSVPIYLGAPNIDNFAPGDHCFINAADWKSPEALARYLLELAGDKSLYAEFFDWKEKPFRPRFSELIELVKEPAFVRLCKKVDAQIQQALQ